MPTYESKTKPYKHQIAALSASKQRAAFAYFMEMGTGKTKVLIDEVGILRVNNKIDTVFYVTARGNYANFTRRELATHMSDEINYRSYMWTGSNNTKDREEIRRITDKNAPYLRILSMNIEALSASPKARELAKKFIESGRCLMAVDESTLIKSPDSIRSSVCIDLGEKCDYRRIMTGHESPSGPLDLWSQFEFLGRGLLGFRSFMHFRARYAVMSEIRQGQRMVKIPVAWQNLDDLAERVAQHSYRVYKKDCLDLPPKIYEIRDIELTDEQKRIYKSLVDNFWAEIGEGSVTVQMAMIQSMRLHQVLCGYVKLDDGTITKIETNRPQAMLDVIQESVEPAIVWCAYRQDATLIASTLRSEYGDHSVVEYHGGVALRDREEAIDRFQDRRARFFVGTPQSGGRGITLTAAGLVIYYSNPPGLEYRLQSEDRAHRVGQTRAVTYVDLCVPGSVDEKILKSYRAGMDISAAIARQSPREWVI